MNHKHLSVVLSFCFCAVAGFYACDDNESSSTCDEGQKYVNGTCQDITAECDPACESDSECIDGECKEKTPATECDPACESDSECIDGECKEKTPTNECNPACEGDSECVNGECKEKTPTTECNPACESDSECIDGECKEKTPTNECNPACEDGEICLNGECQSDPEIIDIDECNPACSEGKVCQNGECIETDSQVGEFRVSNESLVTIQTMTDASFTVYLTSAPDKTVTIPIQSQNENAGTLSVTQVELTPETWESGQKVTVKGTTDKQPEDVTTYQIIVGPTQSDDKTFDGLSAVSISVSHFNLTEGLKLDKTEDSLLLRKIKKTSEHMEENSATFTAILPESKKDNKVTWTIQNADDNDKTDLKNIIQIGEDCTSGKATCTISRVNIDLLSEDNLTKKLDYARTLVVKASSDNCGSAEAKLKLKPYLPVGFNYGYLTKNVKDFGFNSPNKSKGNLSCEYYNEESLKVMNEDMYRNYVVPNMYKNSKGELIPTRASVVAAARFLVLQFPRDIPYSGTHKYLKFDGIDEVKKDAGRMTLSSYVWTTWTLPKGKNYKEHQLFGLNLTPKGYNDPVSFDSENVVANDLESWGCSYEEFFKNKYKDEKEYAGKSFKFVTKNGEDTNAIYAGLMCSGFVSWSIHNGMFDIGNVYTSVFAKNYKNGKVVGRNYQDESKLYSSPKINENVNVLEKLAELDPEKDFISLDKIDKENTVGMKAGDLLWYSGACTCKTGQSCPEECTCDSGGHLAMILGIYKSKGKISTIYVAEAQDAGNRMTYHYIDKSPYLKDWNKSNNACKEIKLIKMGNVYNHATKDETGEAKYYGDTWKYDEIENFF